MSILRSLTRGVILRLLIVVDKGRIVTPAALLIEDGAENAGPCLRQEGFCLFEMFFLCLCHIDNKQGGTNHCCQIAGVG